MAAQREHGRCSTLMAEGPGWRARCWWDEPEISPWKSHKLKFSEPAEQQLCPVSDGPLSLFLRGGEGMGNLLTLPFRKNIFENCPRLQNSNRTKVKVNISLQVIIDFRVQVCLPPVLKTMQVPTKKTVLWLTCEAGKCRNKRNQWSISKTQRHIS